ncbi:uncharacterized protein LOC142177042 [Nicotiana tabacum]|uniref:Uncharacterized protein LOC142177042 n=1 Tax=Nicotiana tabacum TaxID=4097 RepID=A0AC58TWM0_TOBAC
MGIEDDVADKENGVTGGISGGGPMVIDHNHPLYLYPSDGPGSMSIGFLLIGMDNYMIWSRAMKLSLLGKNKLDFVDDTISKEDFEPELWKLCDRKELVTGVLLSSNAHDIWSALEECFDKGTSYVSVYFTRLKDLWDEYDSLMALPCGCPKSKEFLKHLQHQRLYQFLMGLNEGYNQAGSQILLQTRLPTVSQAYAKIVQDES